MSISGKRRRRTIEEMAEYLAQSQGGSAEDHIEQLMPNGKLFNDKWLIKDGYEPVKQYNYTAPDGTLLYQSCRYHHKHIKGAKTFLQRKQDPDTGEWLNGAGPIKVPYRWQGLAARPNDDVFVTEGEKDADRLAELGLLATTVAGQNWSDTAAMALQNCNVFVLEDNDQEGRDNATASAEVLQGVAKSIRIVRLPGLGHKQDVSDWLDAGHTTEELTACCQSAPTWGVSTEPHDFPDETTLELWDWLYGKHLLRDTVSGTAAMGGTGKTSLSIIEALALASGKNLLGESVNYPMRVLLINLEDNRNAMDKRIQAAMKHHGLRPEDIGGRLFTVAKGEMKLKVARGSRSGDFKRNDKQIADLTQRLIRQKIDVLSIDPFIRTHGVNENDNEAIQAVVECYEDMAEAACCAIHLWHHTRKGGGNATTVESARGAIAFVDACRSARILETMTREEAKKLRIERPGFYFREFSGKRNFAPPMDQSTWYQLVSVNLNNSPVFGDEVGVVTHWVHPGTVEPELTQSTITEIRQKVAEGQWREDLRADMWVGKAIAPVLGLDPEDDKVVLKQVIKKLLLGGHLKRVLGQDDRRRQRTFIHCSNVVTGAGF